MISKGVRGGILDERRPKEHMAMMRRAVRQGWPISDEMRRLIMNQMALIVGRSEKDRDRVAAAKVIVSADSVNVRREQMDQLDALRSGAPQTVDLDNMSEEELLQLVQRLENED
jgi:nicotinate-nucleotide pyrophosphorylase